MTYFKKHQPVMTIDDHRLVLMKELINRQRYDSRVLKVKDIKTQTIYTLKRVTCNNEEEVNFIMNEIEMNKKFLSCRNIITVYGYNIEKNEHSTKINILREYCNISLAELISSSDFRPFPEETIIKTIGGIANAISILHHHSPPIIHCDIRTDHVLLTKNDVPKLIDFGASCIGEYYIKNIKDAIKLEKEIKHSTIAYRAPEFVELDIGTLISCKVDVWSLGCILYRMAFFRYPFGESAVSIRYGKYKIPKWNKYSSTISTLLSMMLQVDPEKRASIDDVIKYLQPKIGNTTVFENITDKPNEDMQEKERRLEDEENKIKSVHSDLEAATRPEIQLMKKEKRDICQRLLSNNLGTEEEEDLEEKKDVLENKIKRNKRNDSVQIMYIQSDVSPSSASSTSTTTSDHDLE